MTPEQKALVKASYQRLVPLADTAAQLFYSRLFATDPSLRALFKADFQDQAAKFADMVRVLVAELDDPDKVGRTLRELGRRHAVYGVIDAHYDTVGESLVWAIDKALGREARPELKEAWAEFYDLVANSMKEASAKDAPS
jgi:hemoglobin-like flavoprotein